MAVNTDSSSCTGCGICIDTCAVSALSMENDVAKASDECTECGICIDECPTSALSLP